MSVCWWNYYALYRYYENFFDSLMARWRVVSVARLSDQTEDKDSTYNESLSSVWSESLAWRPTDNHTRNDSSKVSDRSFYIWLSFGRGRNRSLHVRWARHTESESRRNHMEISSP